MWDLGLELGYFGWRISAFYWRASLIMGDLLVRFVYRQHWGAIVHHYVLGVKNVLTALSKLWRDLFSDQ